MRSNAIKGMKLLFTPLAFAFLCYFALQSKHELAQLIQNASPNYLCAAVLVWALLHLLSPVFAVVALAACGAKVSWRQAFATHAVRLPARYLPGGIWHTVGRVMDYSEQGVQPRHLTAFVLLENALAAAVTLAIGGAVVFGARGTDSIGMVAALASVTGIVAVPSIALITNSRVLQQADRLSVPAYAKSVALSVVFWLGASGAFLLYIGAFSGTTTHYSQIEMGGMYLFSWGVGFISIFAPQGIGVFEVVASELMSGPIGFMGLAALLAGFRVVVLVADIIVWLGYQAMRRIAT